VGFRILWACALKAPIVSDNLEGALGFLSLLARTYHFTFQNWPNRFTASNKGSLEVDPNKNRTLQNKREQKRAQTFHKQKKRVTPQKPLGRTSFGVSLLASSQPRRRKVHFLLGFRFLAFGFWFWVFGFWFWVLGFGFWVLGFGFWVLGFGFWVLGRKNALPVFSLSRALLRAASYWQKGRIVIFSPFGPQPLSSPQVRASLGTPHRHLHRGFLPGACLPILGRASYTPGSALPLFLLVRRAQF
jgi:hypothetical protein